MPRVHPFQAWLRGIAILTLGVLLVVFFRNLDQWVLVWWATFLGFVIGVNYTMAFMTPPLLRWRKAREREDE
ncbi:hypothetical protein LCGC14_0621200 [marine sediment metagenome]|uniref:Uncharacterized protein n=1 Tax=marine sediment metagenome TaxID=412755 RepID=A0A0F9UD81_9ZZZZ